MLDYNCTTLPGPVVIDVISSSPTVSDLITPKGWMHVPPNEKQDAEQLHMLYMMITLSRHTESAFDEGN